MSSAPVLFDMRISGSTRASAFVAGSSEGNTLSVTAMIGRGISSLQLQRFDSCAAVPQTRPAPSPQRGEGWGEGVRTYREIITPHPNPLPPNPGLPKFGIQ